jgi:hypothetical protein
VSREPTAITPPPGSHSSSTPPLVEPAEVEPVVASVVPVSESVVVVDVVDVVVVLVLVLVELPPSLSPALVEADVEAPVIDVADVPSSSATSSPQPPAATARGRIRERLTRGAARIDRASTDARFRSSDLVSADDR